MPRYNDIREGVMFRLWDTAGGGLAVFCSSATIGRPALSNGLVVGVLPTDQVATISRVVICGLPYLMQEAAGIKWFMEIGSVKVVSGVLDPDEYKETPLGWLFAAQNAVAKIGVRQSFKMVFDRSVQGLKVELRGLLYRDLV